MPNESTLAKRLNNAELCDGKKVRVTFSSVLDRVNCSKLPCAYFIKSWGDFNSFGAEPSGASAFRFRSRRMGTERFERETLLDGGCHEFAPGRDRCRRKHQKIPSGLGKGSVKFDRQRDQHAKIRRPIWQTKVVEREPERRVLERNEQATERWRQKD